jgi:hypothetical protein
MSTDYIRLTPDNPEAISYYEIWSGPVTVYDGGYAGLGPVYGLAEVGEGEAGRYGMTEAS